MAMEVRTKDVRAHVIALRASASWSLEQKKFLSCAHFVIINFCHHFCELVFRAEMVNSMCTVAARGGILCNELGAVTNSFNLGTIVTRFAVVSASKTVAIVASECSRIGFSPAATVNLTLVLVDTPPRIKFARLLFIEVHMMYDSIDPDEAMRAPTIVVGTMIPGASTFML
jgi:hypothetical protein